VAIIGAVLAFVLLGRQRLPAMLALLAYGAIIALALDPALRQDLSELVPHFRFPTLHIPDVAWSDVLTGRLVLAVPPAALTLGNAVIATAAEHNSLFPKRPISVRLLALDHGLMNLIAAPLGGVPMCRGAGGMAGHIRFGARTGGALVILGAVLLALALFFSDSVATLFRLFPPPVLGVILFFGGMELAASITDEATSRADRSVLVVTAGIALWNMGAAYLAGLLLYHAACKGLVRFVDRYGFYPSCARCPTGRRVSLRATPPFAGLASLARHLYGHEFVSIQRRPTISMVCSNALPPMKP